MGRCENQLASETVRLAERNQLVGPILFPVRGNIVLNQLRGDGLYTNFAAPTFNQHGGHVPAGYNFTLTASPGAIYYTTDGFTDPRLPGGALNGSSAVKVYTGAVSLNSDALVRARLRTSAGQWSGLVEASFDVIASTLGDFNRDGATNGADFLAWQRAAGALGASPYDGADATGDSRVDQADLTVWAAHWGPGPGVVTTASLTAASASKAWLATSPLAQSGETGSSPRISARDVALRRMGRVFRALK